MDELFRRTFGLTKQVGGEGKLQLMPAINSYVKDKKFFIEAELPGVRSDDLDLSIDGDILTLHGKREAAKESKDADYFVRESHYGSFVRRLNLPDGVDSEKIQAKFDNGLLIISMPIEKKISAERKILIEGVADQKKDKKVH